MDVNMRVSGQLPVSGENMTKGVAPSRQLEEKNENLAVSDEIKFSGGKKTSEINYKSLIAKTVVSAAVGAGVMALTAGSGLPVLAALGYSTAIGAGLGIVKGIGHAIYKSLDFGGSSVGSGNIDKNLGLMAGIMGVVGAAKGIAQGAVYSALAFAGFGPVGGAVAGAVMPTVGKGLMHLFNKHQQQNHYLRD